MPARPTDRPVWLVPTLLLFVVLPIGLAVATALSQDDGAGDLGPRPKLSRAGSTIVDDRPSVPLPFTDEPATYALTYRLERYDRTRVQVTEETMEVRRPFDARVTTVVDGKVVATRASRFGTLVIGTGMGPRALVSPPAPATSDIRASAALAEAVGRGFVEVRERRRVLGRECQVYRSGSTITAGELVPIGSREGEHADDCFDARGLLLEEVWFKEGRPLQRRVVTARKVDIAFDDASFTLEGEQELSLDEGNGIFRAIDPASGYEGTTYRLAAGPPGFTYLGRFVVQPPNLKTFRDPLREDDTSRQQVSVIDAWERGPDLVTLAQTIVADASVAPRGGPTARPVQVAEGGLRGEAVLDLRANEIRLTLPESRYLRLSGTLTSAQLLEIAGSLRAETGTGIKVLEAGGG